MSSPPPPPPTMAPEALILAGQNTVATKYYLCAAFTILLYDHMLTFWEEYEFIWKKRQGVVTWVFLLSRYYTPIGMTAIMVAFFDINMSREKFVPFEPFGFGIPLIAIPGALLILRVYAIYKRNLFVLFYLSALLVAQVVVGIWQFSFPGGGPVQFPPINSPVFHGCLYTAAASLGKASGAYLVVDLFFDVSVFSLTMIKTWHSFWNHRGPGLLRRISQDGAMYFVVIFTANSVWLFMVLFATPTLQYINALPAIILDVTMINRLTMSLRGAPERDGPGRPDIEDRPHPQWGGSYHQHQVDSKIVYVTPDGRGTYGGQSYELDPMRR